MCSQSIPKGIVPCRKIVTTSCLLLFLAPGAVLVYAQESSPLPSPSPSTQTGPENPSLPVFDPCIFPELQTVDDFYQVNPMLRQSFYEYLDQASAHPFSRANPSNNLSDSDTCSDLIRSSFFRSFVLDLLNSHKVLQETVVAFREEWERKKLPANIPVLLRQLKTIRGQAGRLHGKLKNVLPFDPTLPPDRRLSSEKYFDELVERGGRDSLARLLLLRMQALDHRFSELLFPQSFTVTARELSERSTPLIDLHEIRILAEALTHSLQQSSRRKNR